MVLLFSGLVKLKYSKFTVSLTDCSDIFFLEVWLFLPLPCVRSPNNPEEILFRQMMQPVAWRQKQQVVGRKWKKYSSTKEVMYLCVLCTVPVHAGEISPEVPCSVSGTDFDCVNKNRVTLQKKSKIFNFPRSLQLNWKWKNNSSIINNNLKKSADVRFVFGAHEDHVFKQPEERPVLVLPGLQQSQDAVELKK